MLTMIMALGVTASVLAAPATDITEKEVPPAEVSLARIQNAPWQELGYLEPDFDDPMYQGGGDSDTSSDSDCQ